MHGIAKKLALLFRLHSCVEQHQQSNYVCHEIARRSFGIERQHNYDKKKKKTHTHVGQRHSMWRVLALKIARWFWRFIWYTLEWGPARVIFCLCNKLGNYLVHDKNLSRQQKWMWTKKCVWVCVLERWPAKLFKIKKMKPNKTSGKKSEEKKDQLKWTTLILMFVFRVRVKEGAYEGKISRC